MSLPSLVFAACAVVSLLAHGAILMSTVRARAAQPADSTVPRPRAAVEAAWALLPLVALAFVLTATWAHVQDRGRGPAPAEIMKVAQ